MPLLCVTWVCQPAMGGSHGAYLCGTDALQQYSSSMHTPTRRTINREFCIRRERNLGQYHSSRTSVKYADPEHKAVTLGTHNRDGCRLGRVQQVSQTPICLCNRHRCCPQFQALGSQVGPGDTPGCNALHARLCRKMSAGLHRVRHDLLGRWYNSHWCSSHRHEQEPRAPNIKISTTQQK